MLSLFSPCVRLYNREQNRRSLHIAEFAQTILTMAVSFRMDSGNPAKTEPPSVVLSYVVLRGSLPTNEADEQR